MTDTRLVKARLDKFINTHRVFTAAQRKLEAAEAKVRVEQARLTQCDARQDDAIEGLARVLTAAGQPRLAPFASFSALPPSALKELPFADEAKAIHVLVVAVQRGNSGNQMVLDAASAADKAAQEMEAALLGPLDALQKSVLEARHSRDVIGHAWNIALAALKRGARAAADEGAPGLYVALFGVPVRSARKKAKAAPPEPTPPQPTIPPTQA